MTPLHQFFGFSRTRRIKSIVAIALQVGTVAFATSASAEAPTIPPIKNVYEVAALGSPVGTIEIVREQRMAGGAPVNHQSVVVVLNFDFGRKSYSFTVDSQIDHDEAGIANYTHNIRENNKHHLVTGRRVEGKLWLRTERIRTKSQQENKALSDVAIGTASQAIPYLGLLTSLFSSNSDGSIIVPMTDFDVSEDELFDKLSSLQPSTGEQRYRVLNTETLEINMTTVTHPREDVVVVGGKDHPCLRVDIDSKNHTRTACIGRDALGGYLIVESGRDKDGLYSIRLVR